MAKSKARFLSELLGSTGLVKKSKSELAGADEVLDLDTIPTIPNSKLQNSSISIAGHSTALGGSVSLNTGNISEHTDYKYYTDVRARGAVSVSGDLAYNSSTGVISFTERTDAEVRGLFSAGGSLSYNSSTGVMSFTMPAQNTSNITEGTNLYFTNARARSAISATGSLSYNSTTGVMSFTMPAQNTSNITEGTNLYYTNARADARIAAASTSDLSEGTNLYYTDARADARVALIVDSAPGTLNTLNELAAALGDDANFSTTITNSIATKLPLAGGALTGAVTTNSTFDGRNVSVDGAKLDGIEAGATADQTAAQILTAIKTVDGSGSGLDADLLDGLNSASFIRLDTSSTQTQTAQIVLKAHSNGWVGGLKLISQDASDEFQIHPDNNGYMYVDKTWNFSATPHVGIGNPVWYTGNDGSGSGLDADLLDGNQASAFYTKGVETTSTTSLILEEDWSTGTYNGQFVIKGSYPSWETRGNSAQPYGWLHHQDSSGNYTLYSIAGYTGTSWTQRYSFNKDGTFRNGGLAGNVYYHQGNDGSGSGLDADLLDGQQGSYYTTAANLTGDFPSFVQIGDSATYGTNSGSWGARLNVTDNVHAKIEVGQDANSMLSHWYAHTGQDSIKFGTSSGHDVEFQRAGSTNLEIESGGVKFYSPIRRNSHHASGFLEGSYNNIGGNGAKSNPIYTIGSSYNPSDAALGNMYGIGFTDGAASFISGTGFSGWGMYVAADGDARVYLSGQWGTIASTGQHYVGSNVVWNAGNDGSGTGLDADLLDGVQGSGYVKTDGSNPAFVKVPANYTGNLNSIVNAGVYFTEAASGISNNPFGSIGSFLQFGDAGGSDVRLQFYAKASLDRIAFRNQWGSGNWGGWHEFWTTQNDGSGSGLDADTVDGVQAAAIVYGGSGLGTTNLGFASMTNQKSGFYDVYNSGTPTATWYSLVNMAHYGANHGHQIAGSFYSAGDLYNRNNNNTSLSAWAKIWNTANDGSGSGLDADLLDGVNSDTAANANTIVKRDANGYINGVYFNSAIGVSESIALNPTKIYMSNDNYIRTMSKSDFKVRMNLTKNTYDRMNYTSNTHYHTGANSHNEVSINGLWERGSGFIDNWNSGAGKPPSGSHFNGFQALHYSSSSVYHHGMQMLMSAGNPALTFLRGWWANGGSGYAWQKIWTDGNDGSGSGLDADLLDGANAAENGASTIHKIASNGYSQLQNWTNVAGSGLYSSTTNSAHWYPNTATSYGTWRIDGSRGGYSGIYLHNGGAVVIGMYDSSGNGGDYHQASGKWSHYWHRGNACLGIGDSTTSSSYSLYVTGAIYATNNITAYSDRRVKENIVQIDGALEKVNKLTGVYYNKIDDEKKNKEIGFIAQDVNEVVPELVTYAEDVDQYGVKYGNTTALLVEAVKELTQQVKDLKQEIDKMKEKQ
jgi:predicted RecA/RadA family phage recombinase